MRRVLQHIVQCIDIFNKTQVMYKTVSAAKTASLQLRVSLPATRDASYNVSSGKTIVFVIYC